MRLVAIACGLVACVVEVGDEDELLETSSQELVAAPNGINAPNGMQVGNGMQAGNGFHLPNGLVLPNGIQLGNGIQVGNGINAPNGIQVGNGIINPPGGSDLDKFLDCNCGSSCPQGGSCSTANQRKALQYLVECAMPASRTVTLKHNGTTYATVAGVGGLAASWANCTSSSSSCNMTSIEQQKVTACLLARVNGKGASVNIGMHGPYPGFDTFVGTTDATYDSKEASFMGNLFVNPPVAKMVFSLVGGSTYARACDVSGDCAPILFRQEGSNASCNYSSNGRWAKSCNISGVRHDYPITVWLKGFPLGSACTYSWQCRAAAWCYQGACYNDHQGQK